MTAKELVWKFYNNIEHTISDEYADKDWEIAKQCAIIAQENLLDKLASLNIKDEFEEAVLFEINAL